MAKKNDIISSDTLATKFDTLRTGIKSGLLEYLGKDLYTILETKEVGQGMPFGFKSRYDILDRSLNLSKKWGKEKDWQFDATIVRNRALLNIKKTL